MNELESNVIDGLLAIATRAAEMNWEPDALEAFRYHIRQAQALVCLQYLLRDKTLVNVTCGILAKR